MKTWAFLIMGMVAGMAGLEGCGQGHGGGGDGGAGHGGGGNHGGGSGGVDRLTCLVPGYDSIIYYTGISKEMQDVNHGKVTDSVFMDAMFKKIKDGGLSMTIKPGGGADMLENFREVINLANLREVDRRSVDSGDENEEKAFGFVTPQVVRDAMNGQSHPEKLKLDLPRDEPNTPNAVSKFPKASQLVVLNFGDTGIYAYMGGYFTQGKTYTYQELINMLKEKRPDSNFSVAIKPAASSTYKNTVDMLDAMRIADVKHYALVDISKEEEEYLKRYVR
jgi:hypothetical protein